MQPLRIQGWGVYIPSGRLDLERKVRLKQWSKQEYEKNGYRKLYVASNGVSQSDMAYQACLAALKQAKLRHGKVDLVVFSSIFLKERSMWSVSADLCNRLSKKFDTESAEFLDLYQGCNAFISSLDFVQAKFCSNSKLKTALVVSSELFPKHLVKRWDCDYGACYGDGAGAVVISKKEGQWEYTASSTKHISALNDFIFLDFASYSSKKRRSNGPVFDLKTPKKNFLQKRHKFQIQKYFDDLFAECISDVLKQTRVSKKDIAAWVIPNWSSEINEHLCEALNIPRERTTLDYGRDAGHMGSVDTILNMHFLLKDRMFSRGDHIIALNGGAGMTISASLFTCR